MLERPYPFLNGSHGALCPRVPAPRWGADVGVLGLMHILFLHGSIMRALVLTTLVVKGEYCSVHVIDFSFSLLTIFLFILFPFLPILTVLPTPSLYPLSQVHLLGYMYACMAYSGTHG